jgi:hypothetical protein
MAKARRLGFPRHKRPFWLLVALSVTLLTLISTTRAEGEAGLLLATLSRDIGALRAHLEAPGDPAPGRPIRTAAFNADLGDGGPAFRQVAALRVARGARGRARQLIGLYRAAGDERRLAQAEQLWLGLHRLEERLASPARAGEVTAAGGEDEVLAALDRALRALLPEEAAPP